MGIFDEMLSNLAQMIERTNKVKSSVDAAGTGIDAPQKISADFNLDMELTSGGPDDLAPTREEAEALYASSLEQETKDLRDKLSKYIFKG